MCVCMYMYMYICIANIYMMIYNDMYIYIMLNHYIILKHSPLLFFALENLMKLYYFLKRTLQNTGTVHVCVQWAELSLRNVLLHES